jgi:hypothetical protein
MKNYFIDWCVFWSSLYPLLSARTSNWLTHDLQWFDSKAHNMDEHCIQTEANLRGWYLEVCEQVLNYFHWQEIRWHPRRAYFLEPTFKRISPLLPRSSGFSAIEQLTDRLICSYPKAQHDYSNKIDGIGEGLSFRPFRILRRLLRSIGRG